MLFATYYEERCMHAQNIKIGNAFIREGIKEANNE